VTLHWLLTGAALVLAAVALVVARRQSKRLERLTESYWELRYEHGQLRAHVNRIDPAAQQSTSAEPAPANFIPLSSLKR
jgi:type II secretory pathway component PulJ